eukprot:382696_1
MFQIFEIPNCLERVADIRTLSATLCRSLIRNLRFLWMIGFENEFKCDLLVLCGILALMSHVLDENKTAILFLSSFVFVFLMVKVAGLDEILDGIQTQALAAQKERE